MSVMTKEEKKEHLLQYRAALQEETRLSQEIERWRTMAEHMTAGYGPVRSGTGDGRKLERTVAKLSELISQLTAQREELIAMRYTIEAAINAMEDDRLRWLLKLRYIEGMTWECVAERMGYDTSWVTRLHRTALEQLALESTY